MICAVYHAASSDAAFRHDSVCARARRNTACGGAATLREAVQEGGGTHGEDKHKKCIVNTSTHQKHPEHTHTHLRIEYHLNHRPETNTHTEGQITGRQSRRDDVVSVILHCRVFNATLAQSSVAIVWGKERQQSSRQKRMTRIHQTRRYQYQYRASARVRSESTRPATRPAKRAVD